MFTKLPWYFISNLSSKLSMILHRNYYLATTLNERKHIVIIHKETQHWSQHFASSIIQEVVNKNMIMKRHSTHNWTSELSSTNHPTYTTDLILSEDRFYRRASYLFLLLEIQSCTHRQTAPRTYRQRQSRTRRQHGEGDGRGDRRIHQDSSNMEACTLRSAIEFRIEARAKTRRRSQSIRMSLSLELLGITWHIVTSPTHVSRFTGWAWPLSTSGRVF